MPRDAKNSDVVRCFISGGSGNLDTFTWLHVNDKNNYVQNSHLSMNLISNMLLKLPPLPEIPIITNAWF